VRIAHDGAAGLAAALDEPPDLIVLDVMMPHLDGIEVCARLRAAGLDTPVLFLTVKAAAADRVEGLEAGGDDYLAKPFHLKELLLRVAAILRRSAWYRERASTPLRFGDNEVDFATYRAQAWDGREHDLPYKEAMILRLLSDQAGCVVTREDILEHVWGQEVFPSTRTVDNFIVRLRKRFERNPEQPVHIHTVRGVGYRLSMDPDSATATDAAI
jgi:two-component system alkaline phosphatase synthesis response regulator PhoP